MLLHINFSVVQDITRLHAKGVGTVSGRLFLGTAEKIPESELVDTTGAGDAFIGAILYGMYMSPISLSLKYHHILLRVRGPKFHRSGWLITGQNRFGLKQATS